MILVWMVPELGPARWAYEIRRDGSVVASGHVPGERDQDAALQWARAQEDARTALAVATLPDPDATLIAAMARIAKLCDQSAAAIRLGGAGSDDLVAERFGEVARMLREEMAAALIIPRPA